MNNCIFNKNLKNECSKTTAVAYFYCVYKIKLNLLKIEFILLNIFLRGLFCKK